MKVQSKLLAYGVLSLWTVLSICAAPTTRATAPFSWTETEPVVSNVSSKVGDGATCRMEEIKLASENIVAATGQYYSKSQACVTNGATVDVAINGQVPKAIRIGGDTMFHELIGDSDRGYLVPGTDIYVSLARKFNSNAPSALVTYRSLPLTVTPVSKNALGIVTRYQSDRTKGVNWLQKSDDDGTTNYRDVYSMVSSPNGRYVLAYVERSFFVKIDTLTGVQTIVSYKPSAWYSSPAPTPSAISDDGKYAYTSGSEDIIDMRGCGDDYESVGPRREAALLHMCQTRNLSQLINDSAGYQAYSLAANFIDDGHGLEITTSLFPGMYGYTGPSEPKKIQLHGANYVPSQRLKYLALGDSYTSGEGDIAKDTDGKSFYLPGTEDDGQCHVSSRSYPFLLRDRWNVSSSGMKSVACSGALVGNDYYADAPTYIGQHRETADMNFEEKAAAQKSALDNFTPGIVPQLEFVKKNKPMAITITGGGNDVGFAKILYYCASDLLESGVFNYSCEYVAGGALHQVLNDAIDTQYAASKKLVQAIQRESPSTKIYYVGYPSFIAGSEGSCAWNNGSLDDKERDMINQAITRMNSVLRAVAAATGVQYVDVESSLAGGRLCEGSQYMTGVWDVALLTDIQMKKGLQNAIHPNAVGHRQIADAIFERVPDVESIHHPEPPIVKIVEPVVATYPEDMLDTDTITAGGVLRVTLKPNTVLGSSDVVMTGYSTPVDLGSYVSNSDGSIEITAEVPDRLNPGLHTLTLAGISPSGEAVRYYQQFAVESDDPNDSDGDGIANDKDGCSFMKSWYDEDGQDMCLLAARTSAGESNGAVTEDKKVEGEEQVGSIPGFSIISSDTDFLISDASVGDNPLGLKVNEQSNDDIMKLATRTEDGKSASPLWISALVGATLLGIIIVAYLKK